MPLFEYECERCGERFEELLDGDAPNPPCPSCGAPEARRLLSSVAPPARRPQGRRIRESEARRREREAARGG